MQQFSIAAAAARALVMIMINHTRAYLGTCMHDHFLQLVAIHSTRDRLELDRHRGPSLA